MNTKYTHCYSGGEVERWSGGATSERLKLYGFFARRVSWRWASALATAARRSVLLNVHIIWWPVSLLVARPASQTRCAPFACWTLAGTTANSIIISICYCFFLFFYLLFFLFIFIFALLIHYILFLHFLLVNLEIF